MHKFSLLKILTKHCGDICVFTGFARRPQNFRMKQTSISSFFKPSISTTASAKSSDSSSTKVSTLAGQNGKNDNAESEDNVDEASQSPPKEKSPLIVKFDFKKTKEGRKASKPLDSPNIKRAKSDEKVKVEDNNSSDSPKPPVKRAKKTNSRKVVSSDEESPAPTVKKAKKKEDKDDVSPLSPKKESPKPAKSGGKVEVNFVSPKKDGTTNGRTWNNDYNPAKPNYHPIDDASWKHGSRVPYLALAKTLEAIEATSSRLKMIEILANYLRSVIVLSPEDLLFSINLCLNQLAPAYEGIELGIGESVIVKAISQATGRTDKDVKAAAQERGDLGLVAESSRSSQRTLFQAQPLTLNGVFHKLKEVAALTGNASQTKKVSIITSMLVACKYSEARYLARSLAGKLRIGLAEQSVLQAIAHACFLTPPNQDKSVWPPKVLNAGRKMSPDGLKTKIEEESFKLKSCYCECPNYDILVKALLEDGIENLNEHCKLSPGIPPRPMLAKPTKGVADVLHRFDGIKFTCEYKYDGERAQIHLLDDGSIRVYSRNQEDNTSKYPDIVSRFKACAKSDVKSCIIDTEAVAWDKEKEMILPFQVLSTRKRKDANESEIKVQVQVFAFDLLYLNGEKLIQKPLLERRKLLRESFEEVVGEFGFATNLDTDSMEEVQEFLDESIKGNCEGLMVKTLDVNASYELAKRSQKWLKLKKDYLDSGGDSLDLVVIGGFLGKGKRTGTYGGFLLACYDPDNEEFQSICKIGTGFTDEDLQNHTESLKPHIISAAKPYYRFHQQLTPDHWFDAVKVWEVKCADLSLSPVHLAASGIADPERGISLRFPRFLRLREDKKVEDATSSEQVADMYNNQEQVKNSTSSARDDDEEFY